MKQAALTDLNAESDIIMMARIMNSMERSYFRSGSPGRELMAENDWHLAGHTQPSLERQIFARWKIGLDLHHLHYFTQKEEVTSNITSLQLLQHNFCQQMACSEIQNIKQNLWNDNLSALTLKRPCLTSANGVEGTSAKVLFIYCIFIVFLIFFLCCSFVRR